jgi:hypothetical protein
MLLENLCNDGDGGVNGVRDYQHEGLGCGRGNASGEVADDTSVDLEEIVAIPQLTYGICVDVFMITHRVI